jgi:hypothetical protein
MMADDLVMTVISSAINRPLCWLLLLLFFIHYYYLLIITPTLVSTAPQLKTIYERL